jgi:SAM-dependent methyltransferase
VDLCGGSGHLTRTLGELSGEPPVLMDLSFVKLWLARRFTAPGCEAVCADAHAPLPFASSAFRLAVCNDAFHYIWTKALFAREMARVTDDEGIAAITHVHNADQWNPSAGNPLPPRGYRALFERPAARVFGERGLLADVIDGHLNLARCDSDATLSADPSLTVIASGREDVFSDTPLESRRPVRGRLMLNPLYAVTFDERRARLQLQFPSKDYEDEYGASRRYLPDHLVIDRTTLAQIESGVSSSEIDALRERRVVLDLPPHYL